MHWLAAIQNRDSLPSYRMAVAKGPPVSGGCHYRQLPSYLIIVGILVHIVAISTCVEHGGLLRASNRWTVSHLHSLDHFASQQAAFYLA